MERSEPLEESLPAPRDDEPSSLRQDIADELQDHLECALRRQLLTTPNADQARHQVLDRFGNPQQIARQLWFDALKEKMMSQRLMLVLTLVMTLACLTSLGMTFMAIDQGRKASLALIEQTRAANEALLGHLAKLSAAPAVQPSLEWNSVKIPLVSAEPNIKDLPAGYTASLFGHVLDASESTMIQGKLDAEGVVDFGLVRAGSHELIMSTPWDENCESTIEVRPGETQFPKIVCPASPPATAEISFVVDWPSDLRDKQLGLICNIAPLPRQFGTKEWFGAANKQIVAVTDTGSVVNFQALSTHGNYELFSCGWSREPGDPGWDWAAPYLAGKGHFTIKALPAIPHVAWPAVGYRVETLLVAVIPVAPVSAESHRRLKVIGGLMEQAEIATLRQNGPYSAADGRRETLSGFTALTPENEPQFEATAGKGNQWKIRLPDDVCENLRSALAEENASESSQ